MLSFLSWFHTFHLVQPPLGRFIELSIYSAAFALLYVISCVLFHFVSFRFVVFCYCVFVFVCASALTHACLLHSLIHLYLHQSNIQTYMHPFLTLDCLLFSNTNYKLIGIVFSLANITLDTYINIYTLDLSLLILLPIPFRRHATPQAAHARCCHLCHQHPAATGIGTASGATAMPQLHLPLAHRR